MNTLVVERMVVHQEEQVKKHILVVMDLDVTQMEILVLMGLNVQQVEQAQMAQDKMELQRLVTQIFPRV